MDKLLFTTAVILLVGAPGLAAPPTPSGCHGDIINATMVKCITENGFTMAEVSRLIPTAGGAVSFDGNDIRTFCANRDGYTKATECIVQEFNRCQLAQDFSINISMNQTSHIMGMVCDDPNFKMDCVTVLTRDPLALQSCITTNYDVAKELQLKTMQQVMCESGNVGVKCAADILKTCDEHTATVFAAAQSLGIASMCDNASG